MKWTVLFNQTYETRNTLSLALKANSIVRLKTITHCELVNSVSHSGFLLPFIFACGPHLLQNIIIKTKRWNVTRQYEGNTNSNEHRNTTERSSSWWGRNTQSNSLSAFQSLQVRLWAHTKGLRDSTRHKAEKTRLIQRSKLGPDVWPNAFGLLITTTEIPKTDAPSTSCQGPFKTILSQTHCATRTLEANSTHVAINNQAAIVVASVGGSGRWFSTRHLRTNERNYAGNWVGPVWKAG